MGYDLVKITMLLKSSDTRNLLTRACWSTGIPIPSVQTFHDIGADQVAFRLGYVISGVADICRGISIHSCIIIVYSQQVWELIVQRWTNYTCISWQYKEHDSRCSDMLAKMSNMQTTLNIAVDMIVRYYVLLKNTRYRTQYCSIKATVLAWV